MITEILFTILLAPLVTPCQLPYSISEMDYEIKINKQGKTIYEERILDYQGQKVKLVFRFPSELIACEKEVVINEKKKWRSTRCGKVAYRLMQNGQVIAPNLKPSYCKLK